ncbi:hypothetical protein [Pseudomonas amygdali]|uniref:Uncharacterized protein n=2 Tax=Pseudomonas amygdali pv. lachrymans TaxID=53707 RepID=A0ABR5KRC9_PSEAV|nr:hypothetical protein [Pseudomonas amygdali]AXH59760.1 hypothetical protein PLA107_031550 [Pseudomonas amygdali pv. lachrymans str. M301315]KPC17183.1 Uncharacterized protein AC499_0385 [Pseudomonas amygdali pv. lachrymans]KPC18142.1 Uncharacterized protein AC499_1344 [Pseudomonas amygdali pv. lachrymans]RMT05888.1 hypothetical protein ALP54_102397 [Pseudomonas amygdali pv. lachrymans]
MIKPYPSEQLHDRVDQFFNSITYQVRPEAKKRLIKDMATNPMYRSGLFVRQVIEAIQRESVVNMPEFPPKVSKSASKHLGELLFLADLTRDERGLIILEGLLNKHPAVAQDILRDSDPWAYLKLQLDEHRLRGSWDKLNPFATALLICTPHNVLIELAKQRKRYACLLHATLKDDRLLEFTLVDDDPTDVLPTPAPTVYPLGASSWR